ncbi:MAG: hypothetical protein PUB21_07920 [Bacteroidales bacterium]|nr:hypothetical protein [Bacteroidales bacterium]
MKDKGMLSNMYTSCSDIPLSRFIKVYCGNLDALVISGFVPYIDKVRIANRMIEEYCSFIGNRNLSLELSKRNDLLNYSIKITVLEAARYMLSLGYYKNAFDLVTSVKIKVAFPKCEKDVKRIFDLIGSEMAVLKVRVKQLKDSLERGIKEKNKRDKSADENYFAEERMLVSKHMGYYIDAERITAKDYAFCVKNMLNELKLVSNGKRI